MNLFFRLLSAAALVGAPLLAQQQQPAQTAQGGTPTFRTGTTLIPVDVVVKDKSGKVIENLKITDFAVLEDGKPQKISIFNFNKLDNEPEPPPTLSLADLKPGSAIILTGSPQAGASLITAITIVSGIEPIVTAGAASVQDLIGGWNLSGGDSAEPQ